MSRMGEPAPLVQVHPRWCPKHPRGESCTCLVARESWAPWALDPKRYVLTNTSEADYEVDLEERIGDSAEVLDWYLHLRRRNGQAHATGFLNAVDDIICIQGSLCSFGRPATLSARQVRRKVKEFMRGKANQ